MPTPALVLSSTQAVNTLLAAETNLDEQRLMPPSDDAFDFEPKTIEDHNREAERAVELFLTYRLSSNCFLAGSRFQLPARRRAKLHELCEFDLARAGHPDEANRDTCAKLPASGDRPEWREDFVPFWTDHYRQLTREYTGSV
jgi:hypothetical protein